MIVLRKLKNIILYSNFFIGLCALALVLTNQLTVAGEIHFNHTYWFVFFSTMFTYSFLKFRRTGEVVNDTSHRTWAQENLQLSKNILVITLVATVSFFFMLNRHQQIIVGVLAVVTLFYGFVDIPFLKPIRKLRDFGLLKTFFVALVWSVTTVVVPLSSTFVETDMLVFLLLRRFLFVMALTIVFEIKDLKSDEEYNLKTIPMRLGISNTKLLSQGILFLLLLINCVQYFFFDVSLMNMLAVNLSLLVSIFCIQPVDEETGDWWYYFVLDGMMILQFVFVYAATKYL